MVEAGMALGATACGVVAVVWARRMSSLASLIRRTKTSPAASVRSGLVEVQGTVEADAPFASPFEHTPCVVARWGVDVLGAESDDSPTGGQSRQLQSVWKQRGTGLEMVDFWIRDDSGRVLVRATRSSEPELHFDDASEQRVDPPLSDKIASFLAGKRVSTKTLVGAPIRLREKLIRPGDRVYALGFARKTGTHTALVAGAGQPLILSTKSEEALRTHLRGESQFLMVVGVILSLGGAAALAALTIWR